MAPVRLPQAQAPAPPEQGRFWPAFAFLCLVGSAWHFVHALTGRSWLVGLVAPVNESVWEHTKLVALPALLWAAIVAVREPRRRAALPMAAAAAGMLGGAVIVTGYYAYVAVLGEHLFLLDIALFVVAAAVATVVLERIGHPGRAGPPAAGWAAVALILVGYAWLTLAPPGWPVFTPP